MSNFQPIDRYQQQFAGKNRNAGRREHENDQRGDYRGRGSQDEFSRAVHEESDFPFGGEYLQGGREFRSSRLERESGERSWIGVGESSYSGDQGGRTYTGYGYDENPSYRESGESGRGGDWQGGVSRFGSRTPPNRPSFAGRGPQGYKRSDERIIEDINEHLTRDHDVDASGISVEAKDGEVILKGTVMDRESKRRAEEIAESCSGVRDVQNQLRIQRADSSGAAGGFLI